MPDRPNILLLFTDQQRYDTVAALGNPYIRTPALDRLVAEGTVFTSAYTASPVCIAARCSLLLGQYPHQTGCTANTPMPQDRVSLMEMLHGAGYQTHGVGKMHFSPDSRKLWGFETRDYSEEGGYREGDDFCDFLKANGYEHILNPNGVRSEFYYVPQPSQLPARLHSTQWVGDRSLQFLANRDRTRPFFLWSSYIKPHPPFESPFPWSRLYKPVEMPLPYMPEGCDALLTFWNRLQNRYKYRDQGFDGNLVRLIRAQYYAAISFVDYQVGRVLELLRDQGELDDTLVIYTSDHGELLGDYGCYGKRSILDAAARVPLIVRHPARFPQGVRCAGVVSGVDLLPTCARAAGFDVPGDRVGLDLAGVAGGESNREGVIVQLQQEAMALYGYVTDDWKYVYSAPDNREWLFRRAEGQPEARSLAGNAAYDGVTAAMRQTLIGRLRADGYTEALEGDEWKVYPGKEVPPDPDAWQLFQEGGSVDSFFPEGYEPRCKPEGGLPVKGV